MFVETQTLPHNLSSPEGTQKVARVSIFATRREKIDPWEDRNSHYSKVAQRGQTPTTFSLLLLFFSPLSGPGCYNRFRIGIPTSFQQNQNA